MTDWIEPDDGDHVTKYLIIGWIVLLFGAVQLVAGLLSFIVCGINSTAIFLCMLGGIAGAIGFIYVIIYAIRSE